MFGAKRSAQHKLARRVGIEAHPVVRAALASPLPASVDLSSYQPAILDQGATSSCTAHASSSSVALAYAAAGKPLGYLPSPREIYAATRALERAATSPGALPALADGGAELGDVFSALAQFGVCPMPAGTSDVTEANVNDEPAFAQLEAAAARIVVGPYGINPSSAGLSDVLAAALAADIPVDCAFFCDSAFQHLKPGQVAGAPNMMDPNGGGHAVFLSGYQTQADGSRAFILANSWGESWCSGGRCLVGAEWLATAWEFWPVAVVTGVA